MTLILFFEFMIDLIHVTFNSFARRPKVQPETEGDRRNPFPVDDYARLLWEDDR